MGLAWSWQKPGMVLAEAWHGHASDISQKASETTYIYVYIYDIYPLKDKVLSPPKVMEVMVNKREQESIPLLEKVIGIPNAGVQREALQGL